MPEFNYKQRPWSRAVSQAEWDRIFSRPAAIPAADYPTPHSPESVAASPSGDGSGRPASCTTCGESALGRATDGNLYCHRPKCMDWKIDRWKASLLRANACFHDGGFYYADPGPFSDDIVLKVCKKCGQDFLAALVVPR